MIPVLFAIGVTLLLAGLVVVILWQIFHFPPTDYFFGFQKLLIDYGDFQKSVIYYKVLSQEIVKEPSGRRLEVMEYLLRDQTTRWSNAYLRIRLVNGEVSFIAMYGLENFRERSKLYCVLKYCPLPQSFDLFYQERCLQKVMDQIQYRPLDLAKV